MPASLFLYIHLCVRSFFGFVLGLVLADCDKKGMQFLRSVPADELF